MLSWLLTHVRYAWRMQLRDRMASGVIVLSLATGIAANVAVFSLARGVLLRPLPFNGADRVFDVRKVVAANPETMLMGPEFVAWRQVSKACATLAAYGSTTVTLGGDPNAERLDAAEVSPGFFEALGIMPLAGRGFSRSEEQPGSHVVVVSEAFASSRWAKVGDALGTVLRVDDVGYTIVGVVPSRLPFPNEDVELWMPYEMTPVGLRVRRVAGAQGATPGRVPVLCRLAPSSTLEQAEAEATAVVGGLHVPESRGMRARFVPVSERILGAVKPLLLLLQCAVGLLLLLISANTANLLLARSLDRERDTMVRRSLGATPLQLVTQGLVEAMVPALVGGLLGLVATYWMIDILKGVAPSDIPRLGQVRGDGWLVLVDLGVALLAGAVAAVPPGLRMWRAMRRMAGGPREEGLLSSRSGGRPARQGLIVAEMAVAVILVSSTVSVTRAYLRVAGAPVGFDGRGVTSARLAFPDRRYPKIGDRIDFLQRLVETTRQSPAVGRVSVVNDIPFATSPSILDFTIAGSAADAPMIARSRLIGPDYFRVMRMPLVSGRVFDATGDDYPASPVAVVNQSFARRYLGGDVLGRVIRTGGIDWRIVGVVADTPDQPLAPDEPALYRPFTQLKQYDSRNPSFRWLSRVFLVATDATSSAATVGAVRAALHTLDPALALDEVQPMRARVARSFARTTFAAALMLILAVISSTLAGVGVLGAFTHWVVRRTREFGIRTALGATKARLIRLVLREAALAAVLGLAIGCVLAGQGHQLLAAAIPGVTPSGGTTLVITALIMFLVAALACLPPAVRASRIDPAEALRMD